jgi:hypothetical protein
MNWTAGWSLILAGFMVGAVIGLFFHRDGFLGGYTSFPRRMLRLGHIALVALGMLNLIVAVAGQTSPWLVAGGVLMPAICFLTAWRRYYRHLFFLPVTCLVVAVGVMLWCSGGSVSRRPFVAPQQPALHRSAATNGELP